MRQSRNQGSPPLQEWNRDSRPLTYLDVSVVSEAFLHHEIRKVDKGGCISFKGRKYETKPALIGYKVEISYDPAAPETITVSYPGYEPFTTQPVRIGEFCDKNPTLPAAMQEQTPTTSRFLDALEKKHRNRPARWPMQSPLLPIGRRWMIMYESFFGMEHTPFVRDIPAEKLYESDAFRETLGRLCYVADRQMFAVVNSRSRLWKIHADPQVLFGTSEGRIYHPVSFRFQADSAVVL